MTATRSFISIASLLFLLLLALFAVPARAQQNHPQPPEPVIPGMTGEAPPGSDPLMRGMNERMAMERNTERQQKIVSESAQLLDLAKKLNADVAKSDKNELSVSVVKEADAIEKLAKSIKDKMRYGY
ncbi:MAG TPA: hypothetical protein VME86_02515 [Acidobacteriaceae bacterium]|nr:hypothetical protein [Acidobacteriaceae bacterium]